MDVLHQRLRRLRRPYPPVTPYNTPYNSHSIAFESITPDKYNDWLKPV